jgi:hypothetical protein
MLRPYSSLCAAVLLLWIALIARPYDGLAVGDAGNKVVDIAAEDAGHMQRDLPRAVPGMEPTEVIESYYAPSVRDLEEEDGYVSPSIPEEDIHPIRVPTIMPSRSSIVMSNAPVAVPSGQSQAVASPVNAIDSPVSGRPKPTQAQQVEAALDSPGINTGKVNEESYASDSPLGSSLYVIFMILLTVVGFFATKMFRRYEVYCIMKYQL